MREELEVGHVWHYCVRNFRGFRHGIEIQPEIAFRRSIHCTCKRQSAAVIVQGRNILSHCTGDDDVEVFRVRPNFSNNPLPILPRALPGDEVGEFRVGFQDMSDAISDGRVGDFGAESSGPDVVSKLVPIEMEESYRSEKAGGEDGAEPEDLFALVEAAEHLGVHALEGVGAEDCFVRAGVHVVRVVRASLEVLAFVVACEDRASQ